MPPGMTWICIWLAFSIYSSLKIVFSPFSSSDLNSITWLSGIGEIGLKTYVVLQIVLMLCAIYAVYKRKKWGRTAIIVWGVWSIINSITAVISLFIQRQQLLSLIASQNANFIFGFATVFMLFSVAVASVVISYVNSHREYFSS